MNSFASNHFGITEPQILRTLAAALSKGASYADLFFEHSSSNGLTLQDGAVNRASSNIDCGVGIRAVSGEQSGYAFTESITPKDMLRAAIVAADIASQPAAAAEPVNITETPVIHSLYPIQTAWNDVSVKNKIPHLQMINDKVFAADSRVIKVNAWLNDLTQHIFFCNSLGQSYYDFRPMFVLGVQCVMESGGRIESGNSARSFRMGAEGLTEELLQTVIDETLAKTSILFEAVKPRGGEMPVVMGAGGSGILLHEAIGHAFEADFNRKNISIFSDSLNSKICDASISIVDDGLLPFNRGAVNIDDEGVEGQKLYIVREGVLTSYMHDRISARYYGVAPTGNGRRESFRCPPLPRMRATCMEPGKYSEEEIIAAVKNGVYVQNFTNGQVQIGAGDFTFFVKNGYMIENGKLTRPIKDINIIGNGPKALADITMVGANFKLDEGSWTCGKDGQSCPVSLGMPSALVSNLTVGGDS